MEHLEQQLISSRKVREFLKHFSESQWSRVVKASVIMGIQELERTSQITNLSCQDLEDIVVSNEQSLRSDTTPSNINVQQDQPQPKIIRDRVCSLPTTLEFQNPRLVQQNINQPPNVVQMRRGGRPTQGNNANEARRGSFSQREGGAFQKPYFIQGLTATVTSRQKGHNPNDSIADDLATFGDPIIVPQRQPQRAQSVPRNLDRPAAFQNNESYALPQERPKPKQLPADLDKDLPAKKKPSSNWRNNNQRQPNFGKIGDRAHEQRVRSEQARFVSHRTNEVKSSAKSRQQLLGSNDQDSRRRRNLLPAQMSLAGQRTQSLNPLVYPSWWGDGQDESPKKRSRNDAQQAAEQVQTEQPRIRNQIYSHDAYINTCTTEPTIDEGHVQYQPYQMDPPQNQNLHRPRGSFQLAAERLETSCTQQSSTMSLADALHQAKATADRLQRDLDHSKKYRAQLLQQDQPNVVDVHNESDSMIVDIRNDQQVQQQRAMQGNNIQGQRQASRNSSQRELRGTGRQQQQQANTDSRRVMRTFGQENIQRNGSQRQLQSRGGGVVLQHSPPRTTKTQQVRQEYNSQLARNRAINQNKNTQSGPLPTYLKNVTSKIRDRIQNDKQYTQNMHTQNKPVEIFVGPPPKKVQNNHPQRQHQQQQVQANDEQNYEDSYGRLVKLKYQQSDINQHYAQKQPHPNDQQESYEESNYPPQYDQNQQQIQDPAIINQQYSARGVQQQQRHHMGELVTDLLESPYVQKFADDQHHQSVTNQSSQQSDQYLDTSQQQYPQQLQHHTNQTETEESGIKRQDDSTIQTHHLNAMSSNHVPSSKGGNQPHMFSVENSSSMVMYNGTMRHQGTGAKMDQSAAQYQNDPNGILFDSKAFDRVPSQLHQINSQTGAPRQPSSHNNLTTLNNQPFSLENPTISASSNCQTEEKYRNLQSSSGVEQAKAFQSAGFGGPESHQKQRPYGQGESQYRLSDYEAPVNEGYDNHHQQHHPANRNQTGQDLQNMRQYPQQQQQQQPYANDRHDEQNFSNLIDRVDRMTSEETKIMTFKSQDNGFLQPGQHAEDQRFYQDGGRVNQTNVHEQQYQQNQTQFEPNGTNGTQLDKRGSLNTLSQMTNPFRTKIYNQAPSHGPQTMMSQSEIGGQINNYNGGQGLLQHSDSKLQDGEFSSPEENKTMQQEGNANFQAMLQPNMQRQDTDNDPSSSSMSGYDLKGMLSRVRNQANYVQNNILKSSNEASPNKNHELKQDNFRHQHNGTEFYQPAQPHHVLSQNVDYNDKSSFNAQVLSSHVVSQQNPISARNQHNINRSAHRPTDEQAPSSYHPVVSQDFNPLKTTIGNQDEEIPNSSGLKSHNNEESKRGTNGAQYSNQPMTIISSVDQSQQPDLPQFSQNQMQNQYLPQQMPGTELQARSHRSDVKLDQKQSARNTDDQNTTLTDDLSDYSSSVNNGTARSSHHQASQAHLMMMPKQLEPSSSKQAIKTQNYMQQPPPPPQIHQQNQQRDFTAHAAQEGLENKMQEFIASQQKQQMMVAQSPQAMLQAQKPLEMQFNPPQGKLKPMTDTETSSDDEDLSSGSVLTGTDTSGIDTSSMSQSLQSSQGVRGLLAAAGPGGVPGGMGPGGVSMPRQTKNQYPAMAFNHPKYAGTLQQQQQQPRQ